MKAYPLREAVFALERHTRERSHYAINLQSCELLHPRVIDIFTSLSTINPANIQLYPYPDETREYIAQQWKMSARTLTLSAGSDSIISIIVEALGSITGKVILQVPNYFGWHNYATLRGLSVIAVSFGKPKRHTFCLNVFLENLRASSPSLVVISNPNNPTGFVFSPQEVLILADECEAYGHLLIIDECFASFANINHYKIIGSRENVIFVRSFSKCFGLAGIRIAVTIASERITQYLSHWRPDAAVSGPALQIFEKLISREAELNELCMDIVNSRENFVAAIKKIRPNWHPLPSGGNYVTFYLGRADNPKQLTKRLYQSGYHIRDVSTLPGLDSCVRFGIAHWDIMQGVVKVLKNLPQPCL